MDLKHSIEMIWTKPPQKLSVTVSLCIELGNKSQKKHNKLLQLSVEMIFRKADFQMVYFPLYLILFGIVSYTKSFIFHSSNNKLVEQHFQFVLHKLNVFFPFFPLWECSKYLFYTHIQHLCEETKKKRKTKVVWLLFYLMQKFSVLLSSLEQLNVLHLYRIQINF